MGKEYAKMQEFLLDGDEEWPPIKTKRSCFRSGASESGPNNKTKHKFRYGRVLTATGGGRGGGVKVSSNI